MSKVLDCMVDLQDRAKSIAWVGQRASLCFSPGQMIQFIKGCNRQPGIGIAYEGRSALTEADRLGKSTRALFGVYLILSDGGFTNVDSTSPTVLLLSDLSKTILGQRNPAGNLWTFVAESFVDGKDGYVVWAQRWSTAITE